MIKKVAVLNGRIEHIYHDDIDETTIKGATIEQREMEYTEVNGWREVDYIEQPNELETLTNYVLDVDMRLIMVEMGLF